MAAISLALELARLERLRDQCLPGREAAFKNEAMRSLWTRLQPERQRPVNANARLRLVSSRKPERF
jgi:hypothetical protein